MKNPAVTAIISSIAIVLMASSIFFATETPSIAVLTLEWVFLAGSALGLVGSLIQLAGRR